MIRCMSARLLFILFPLLLVTACAPEPMVRPVAPAEEAADAVIELIAAGRYEQALVELRAREPVLADDERARLQITAVEQYLAARRPMEARQLLRDLRPRDLPAEDGLRLTLAQAELALLDRDPDTATWLLDQISDQIPPSLRSRYQLLRQRLGQAPEDGAVEALDALSEALDDQALEPELALAVLIDVRLASLETLAADPRQPAALRPWLDLARTARAALLDADRLAVDLRDWETRHPDLDYTAADALEWLNAWRTLQDPPQRIALILPRSDSSLARPGRAVRDGLISRWTGMSHQRRPELLFFYIGDGADEVIDAWYAAREAGADQVIGPLQRNHVDRLLELGDTSVPILLLNHPAEPEALHRFPGLVASYGLTPEEEAELVAARALVEGFSRALVLRQDSEWGERVGEAFGRSFRAGDGRIVRDMLYPAGRVDYSILLEVLLELDRSRERSERLARTLGTPVEAESAPRTDADFIFLGARAGDARALRPQLNFFGAGDLPVLATSHVLDGAPDARRNQDLDNVLLPVAPWFLGNGAGTDPRLLAEARYPDLDNPALSRLFALGADAFDLLPWLGRMRDDPDLYLAGLTGRLRLLEPGRIERDLPFVRIIDGRVERQ